MKGYSNVDFLANAYIIFILCVIEYYKQICHIILEIGRILNNLFVEASKFYIGQIIVPISCGLFFQQIIFI